MAPPVEPVPLLANMVSMMTSWEGPDDGANLIPCAGALSKLWMMQFSTISADPLVKLMPTGPLNPMMAWIDRLRIFTTMPAPAIDIPAPNPGLYVPPGQSM